MGKRITIALTDAPPISIDPEKWPCIARAKDWDNQYEFQANRTWELTVRQHEDGRTVVYGLFDSQFQYEPNLSAGVRLDAGADIPGAIRTVGEGIGAADSLIHSCVNDLPAVEVD